MPKDKKPNDILKDGFFDTFMKQDYMKEVFKEWDNSATSAIYQVSHSAVPTTYSSSAVSRKTISFLRPCTHCGSDIHTENEEVFTISHEPKREDKISGKKIKTKFFHRKCFVGIAGEDYT